MQKKAERMATTPTGDHRDVVACDESFFNALLSADREALDTLLAHDFLIVDVMSGQVTGRDGLLAAITSGELQFADVTRYPTDRVIRHRDSVAAVVGRTRMMIRLGETQVTASSRYTHVYVRENRRWRLMSAQGTPVAE
jgi:uncharacterized protein (TIGR02246 family)